MKSKITGIVIFGLLIATAFPTLGIDNQTFDENRNLSSSESGIMKTGYNWSVTEVVSTESTSNSRFPSLDVESDGTINIAWYDYSNYGGSGDDIDIFYKQRSSSGTWSTTEVVSTESTNDSSEPFIVVDDSGTVHVAWFDLTDYGGSGTDEDVFYKQRSSSGTWSTTEVVSTESTSKSWYPSLDVDSDGTVHVAWFDDTNYGGSGYDMDIFYKQRSSSGSWSTTEIASVGSTGHSSTVFLNAESDGTVHVAWFEYTEYGGSGPDTDIFYNQRSNSGTWGTFEVVSTESTDSSYNPTLGVDSGGVVHVVWSDFTDYGGSGSDSDIFYNQRSNSGTWSTTEVVSTESSSSSGHPYIDAEADGTVHLAWIDHTNYNGSGTDGDIFYKQRSSSGTWSTTEVVSTESTYQSAFPSLAVELDGTVHVAWEDFTDYLGSGSDCDIFYKYKTVYSPIPEIPILELVNIEGGILGFSVGLKNFGNKTAYDITWEMTVLDGLLVPNYDSGEISELEPDEEIRIPLKWKFGLGKSTIEFRCQYTISINGTRAGFDVSVKQEWNDLGFLIVHAFPEFMQPVKEWKEIESYNYQEEVKAQGVLLNFEGINQWHNVRVVRSLDSGSSEVAFYGLCKFTDGEAFIEEGWITRSDIENGLAHWEVELVDGE